MSDLDDQLRRAHYMFEEEEVWVVALEDQNISFQGENINLNPDEETQVPLWIAEVLEANKKVTIKSDADNLLSILTSNVSGNKSIDSHFYRKVRSEIAKLRQNDDDKSILKRRMFEGYLDTILRRRAREIVSKFTFRSDRSVSQPEFIKEGPIEEIWLFEKFNEIYSVWNKRVGLTSEEKTY